MRNSRRHIILITISFLIGFQSIGQDSIFKKNDWEILNLKGRVKSYTEKEYALKEDAEVVRKYQTGSWKTYRFSELGFRTEIVLLEPQTENVSVRKKYEYDHFGNNIAVRGFNGLDSLIFKHDLQHDSDGNLSAESIINFQNNTTTKYIYAFDIYGDKIQMIGYNHKGLIFVRKNYKYDNSQNKLEELSRNKNGKFINKSSYIYDSLDKLIEKKTYYDSSLANGYKFQYTYDANDNLIKESYYGFDDSLIDETTYTLDNKFNWIRKSTIEFGVPLSVTERKITYFE